MSIFGNRSGDNSAETPLREFPDLQRRLVDNRYWHYSRLALIELLILQLAVIGGAVAIWRPTPAADNWHLVYVAMGSLCLGFGAAFLLSHHIIRRRGAELKEEFASLASEAAGLASLARQWKSAKDGSDTKSRKN